ncbi:MAG: hypothetical protein IH613_11585 [Desulfuromonadales bacterium]|nr:hypothetical protein [Desulfuromonadales bacterium]
MKSFITPITILLALSLTMMFSACEKGPAEKAGEHIDQAVEKTSDTVKDAKRKVEEGLRN